MNKYIYHYTNDNAQESILNNNQLYFREISDFNKCNDDEELIIEPYYKKAIEIGKTNSNYKLINSLYTSNLNENISNEFSIKYSIDGLDIEDEEVFTNLNSFHSSKVYITSFSMDKNSKEIYDKLSCNSETILEAKVDDLTLSIKKHLSYEIICGLNRVNSDVIDFFKKEEINIRSSFEGIIGKGLVNQGVVSYEDEDKVQVIISDINLRQYVIDNSSIKADKNFKTKLMKLIYIDGHIFKEKKFDFEKEIRILAIVPKVISEKLKVLNTDKDMIALTFDEGIFKQIQFIEESN